MHGTKLPTTPLRLPPSFPVSLSLFLSLEDGNTFYTEQGCYSLTTNWTEKGIRDKTVFTRLRRYLILPDRVISNLDLTSYSISIRSGNFDK